jgi:hypothetical protein
MMIAWKEWYKRGNKERSWVFWWYNYSSVLGSLSPCCFEDHSYMWIRGKAPECCLFVFAVKFIIFYFEFWDWSLEFKKILLNI